MPYSVPTVTIETDNGPVRINASDFDAKIHKIVDGPAPLTVPEPQEPLIPPPPVETPPVVPPAPSVPPVAPPAPPITPAPPVAPPAPPAPPATPQAVSPGVIKEGARWYIVNIADNDAKIGDTDGYPSKAKATEAAQALIAN